MGKKRKKKKKQPKFAEQIRRENELEQYGHLLSLRPSQVHDSEKQYTRKVKHKGNEIPEQD